MVVRRRLPNQFHGRCSKGLSETPVSQATPPIVLTWEANFDPSALSDGSKKPYQPRKVARGTHQIQIPVPTRSGKFAWRHTTHSSKRGPGGVIEPASPATNLPQCLLFLSVSVGKTGLSQSTERLAA